MGRRGHAGARTVSSSETVLYDAADGVATATLNRPDTLNAMNNELMDALREAVVRVQDDHSIRVLVVTGNGRGFCAGADLAQQAGGDAATGEGEGDGVFIGAMRALADCPVPTVARVNGAAAGGGLGLALACDITIAARSAFFVATFGPRLGIVPDMGATWSIPRRVGRARALGMTLLGDRVSAEQAADWGLIWKVVDDDALDAEVAAVTQVLTRSSPATCTRIRQTIDAAHDNSFSEQLDLEMRHQAVLIPRNMRTGAQAFMDKREPAFGPERA